MLDSVAHLIAHEEETRVWHASWSHSGRYLATTGEDKVIHIWTCGEKGWEVADEITCIATLEEGQTRTIRCCEWSYDDRMIASASFDGTIVVWEAQSSTKTHWDQIASLEGHENEVKSVSWSPDGRWLASCGRDKRVWMWEKLGGSEFECVAMLEGHSQDVKFVRWHPTLPILISASYDDSLKVWMEDNDDWFCAQTINAHSSTVWGLSFSADGQKFVSCSDDRSVVVFENDGTDAKGLWRSVATLKDLHKFSIYSIDWSHHNGYIACSSGDNAICVCRHGSSSDDQLLQLEGRIQEAHSGDINCIRWNPCYEQSHILVSTGDDGLVKLWRLTL